MVAGMPWTWRTRARVRPPRPAPTIVTGAVIMILSQTDWNAVPYLHVGSMFQPCQDDAYGDQDAAGRTAHGRAFEGTNRRGGHRDSRHRRRERSDVPHACGAPGNRERSDLLARRQQERSARG